MEEEVEAIWFLDVVRYCYWKEKGGVLKGGEGTVPATDMQRETSRPRLSIRVVIMPNLLFLMKLVRP